MNPLSSKCTASAKRTRHRCQRWVIGGGVCSVHGGKAPQVAARRAARIVEGQALQLDDDWQARDPGEALLSAASDADVVVQRLKQQLRGGQTLDPAALLALGDWVDRVGRLAKVVIDARIDERRTQLAERHGAQLASVIQAILGDLNLTAEQHARVPSVVPMRLREIDAAPPSGQFRTIWGGGSAP